MEVVIEDYRQNVLQNQTITSSGSSGTFTDFGAKEINLVINVTGPVTGTGPTLQFTIREVDPGDGTTQFGTARTSAIITATGVYTVSLPVMVGGDVVVSWTVGGIAPSFGGVYATILNKVAGTSVLYDAGGNPVFGTAGSPGTAVLTVQGVSGGQPSPVSGTVTATQGTAAALSGAWPTRVTDGTNTLPTMDAVARAGYQQITDGTNGPVAVKPASTAAVATDPALVVALSPNNPVVATNPSVGVNTTTAPTSSTQVGGSDGTNLQAARVFDVDTGGGTQYVLGVGLRKAASGGSVEAGTSTDPLRVDPTGTTTQPVSGTVTSNIGTTGGLALDATLTRGTAKTIVRGGAKGATTAADVTSTAEGADHQSLDVQIYHGGSAKDPTQIRALTSSDVVTAAQGTAAALSGAWPIQITDGTTAVSVKAASTAAVAADTALVVAVSPNNVIPISATQLPAALVGGRLDTNVGAWLGSTAPTVGQKTMANSIPIVLASDQSTITIAGTVTANIGTTGGLALDATLTGGTTKAIVRGGAKGATTAADVTSTAEGADHQALDVQIYHGGSSKDPTQIRALTSSDIVTAAQGTAAALTGYWPVRITDGTNTMPTMDATSRRGYVTVTDGTNTQPTLDVASRAGYIRITDGTNTLGTLFNTFHTDPNGDRRTVHSNVTITSSGSSVLTWVGYAEWYLIINLRNAPTGTSPTIQFKIEQVDPLDTTSVLTGSRSFTGVVHTAAGQEVIEVPELDSDSVKISWTVTGASASWTGVNVTFCGHAAGNAIEGQAEVGTMADDPPVPVAGVDDANLIQYLRVDGDGNLQVIVNNISSAATPGVSAGIVILGGATSGTQQAVRATTYTEQTSNAQRSLASSSASDTSAGTGARQVKVTYYTATGTGPFTETVTLNGTAAVATVASDICYIEKMEVVSVGSGGANVGTITLYVNNTGGGGTIGTIGTGNVITGTGDNQTFWAHHYVPLLKTATMATLTVSASSGGSGTNAKFYLKSKDVLTATSPELVFGDIVIVVGAFRRALDIPQKIAGFQRITAYGVPGVNNATLAASFDYSEL